MTLKLYNTLASEKQEFKLDEDSDGKVRMYVCGPTVYNRPHIGNARAVVVYDVLFRLLRKIYGVDHVIYARNITDVDDKINAQAAENGESISDLAQRVEGWFHDDMAALGNLTPTFEPRATEHMTEIIALIERIIANGHAYESQSHVLFDVGSVGQIGDYYYGKLSGKKLEDLIAGARVDIADYKRNAGDFVLWKPSAQDEPGWDSPWGRGRPGWHIECSAMSTKYLGENFDIHGGGVDLKFPHHENEIAQSCCGNTSSSFAKYWIHNGFLTVNGEKMSKSLGNFITVDELLQKGVKGEVIRYVLLSTHYRKPLDFSDKSLSDAKKNLDYFYTARKQSDVNPVQKFEGDSDVLAYLEDDLNTPKVLAKIYGWAKIANNKNSSASSIGVAVINLQWIGNLLGILQSTPEQWFTKDISDMEEESIQGLVDARIAAKAEKNWAEADKIRDELVAMGIELQDSPTGTVWKKI